MFNWLICEVKGHVPIGKEVPAEQRTFLGMKYGPAFDVQIVCARCGAHRSPYDGSWSYPKEEEI